MTKSVNLPFLLPNIRDILYIIHYNPKESENSYVQDWNLSLSQGPITKSSNTDN